MRQHVSDLPIAIVTGEAASDRLEQLKAAGFTVLRKPLDVQALTHWLTASVRT